MKDWRLMIISFNDESFLKQVNDGAILLNKRFKQKIYPCIYSQNVQSKTINKVNLEVEDGSKK